MNEIGRQIMFNPPWWAVALNAHYLPRRALARAMRKAGAQLAGRVLDVGCGVQPYRAMLAADDVIGLELDTPDNRASGKRADIYYDGTRFPFDDNEFDGILCNQVLEHVFEPRDFIAELARVLRPGGILVLSVPFVWPEHEQPCDSQRFTSFGLTHVLASGSFDLLSHTKLVGGGGALAAIAADRLNAAFSRLPRLLRMMLRALLVTPFNLVGSILAQLASADTSIFLDNFIVARKR